MAQDDDDEDEVAEAVALADDEDDAEDDAEDADVGLAQDEDGYGAEPAPSPASLLDAVQRAEDAREARNVEGLTALARRVVDGELGDAELLSERLWELHATHKDLRAAVERVQEVRQLAEVAAKLPAWRAEAERWQAERPGLIAEKKRRERAFHDADRAAAGSLGRMAHARSKANQADLARRKLLELAPAADLAALEAVEAELGALRVRASRAAGLDGASADPEAMRLLLQVAEREHTRMVSQRRVADVAPAEAAVSRRREELEQHERLVADRERLPELKAQLAELEADRERLLNETINRALDAINLAEAL